MNARTLERRSFLRLAVGVAVPAVTVARAATSQGARTAVPGQQQRYSPERDFDRWQAELRRRLKEILALPEDTLPVALNAEVIRDSETDAYTMERIQYAAEAGEIVPGYLLRPKQGCPPYPVMICLQGHSPGMHISIGRAKNRQEEKSIEGGRDLAVQAVQHGWAALVIEQRGFGVRAVPGASCNDVALRALHCGRSLTGQRVFDVHRAIDFIATQPDLDRTRVGCMGNSTGGTVSFYAACVEPRLALAVVSCSFCTFADSWLSLPHCACGYLPGIVPVADMPDLAGLIAPRRLLIVAGRQDNLARFAGVERGYGRAREIFAAAGAADRIRLVAGEGGHQFYPELAWPAVAEMMNLPPVVR